MKHTKSKIAFILKSRSFHIQKRFTSFTNVDASTLQTLLKNKKYRVKSNVKKETFQSFLDHWQKNKVPNITVSNIKEYARLSKEFDRMNDLIQIFHRCNMLSNRFQISKKRKTKSPKNKNNVIKSLDQNYEKLNKSTIKTRLKQKNKLLSEKVKKFHLIIDLLFRKSGIDSYFDFVEYKKELIEACEKEDTKVVDILTRTKVKTDNFIFVLNEDEKTASLLRDLSISEQVFIPRSIRYQNNDYLITSILPNSFKNISNFFTVQFPSDSELKRIERYAFFYSNLLEIAIPSHVKFIGKNAFPYCCEKIVFSDQSEIEEMEINSITISFCLLKEISIPSSIARLDAKFGYLFSDFNLKIIPMKTTNIIHYNNKYILGKSNINSNSFDVLLFVSENAEKAVIPPFIKVLSSYSLHHCEKLQSIEFPKLSKLKVIGKNAFSCFLLEKITIPSSVTHIGKKAFDRTKLKEIDFSPNSKLISIGEKAFSCGSLEKISLPSGVEHFGKEWCLYNDNLTKIEILPVKKRNIALFNNAMIIGKSNFKSDIYDVIILAQKNIQNVLIPSYIRQIGPYAFWSCKEIQSIEFEENSKLQIIDEHSFEYSSLKEISIPSHVVKINKNTFRCCDMLKKIEFTNDSELEFMGDFAFNASSLENISIPSSIKYIGSHAFKECKKLIKIVFQNNIQKESSSIKLGSHAFSDIHIKKIVFPKRPRIKIIPKKAFRNLTIEKVVLPSDSNKMRKKWHSESLNLKNIQIFRNEQQNLIHYGKFILGKSNDNNDIFDVLVFAHKGIETATIPSFVRTISSFAFKNCEQLKEVQFSDESELQLIEKYAFSNTSIEKIQIPKKVVRIGKDAFFFCQKLKNVEFTKDSSLRIIDEEAFLKSPLEEISIPLHVTKIGQKAMNCKKLKNVVFSEKAELKSICEYAFMESLIESITIPSTTTEICDYAFSYCKKLKTVNISKNSELRSIGNYAFEYTMIEKFYIPSKLNEIHEFWCTNVTQLNEITISEDNTNFAYLNDKMIVTKSDPNDDAFDVLFFALRDIKKAVIPPTIKKITSCCFNSCLKLTKIMFVGHSQLQTIPMHSFCGSSIRSISIPQHVKYIENSAFSNCTQLRNVEFPLNSELMSIHSNAFQKSSIEQISIPSRVTYIGEEAFSKCTNLKKIDFPPGLINIDNYSLTGTSIESIALPSQIKYLDRFTFMGYKTIKIIEVNENTNIPDIFLRGLINCKIDFLLIPTKYREFLEIISKNI